MNSKYHLCLAGVFLVHMVLVSSVQSVNPDCHITCNFETEYIGHGCTCEPCSTMEAKCNKASLSAYYTNKCEEFNRSKKCQNFSFGSKNITKMNKDKSTTPPPIMTSNPAKNAAQHNQTSIDGHGTDSTRWIPAVAVIGSIAFVVIAVIVGVFVWRNAKAKIPKDLEAQEFTVISKGKPATVDFRSEVSGDGDQEETPFLDNPSSTSVEREPSENFEPPPSNSPAAAAPGQPHIPVDPAHGSRHSIGGQQAVSVFVHVHEQPQPQPESASDHGIREAEPTVEFRTSSRGNVSETGAVSDQNIQANLDRRILNASPTGANAATFNGDISAHCSQANSNNAVARSSVNSSFDRDSSSEDIASRSDGETTARHSVPPGRSPTCSNLPDLAESPRRTIVSHRPVARETVPNVLAEQTTLPVEITPEGPSQPELPLF